MCGIIAIARQKSSRIPPSAEGIKQSADLSNLGRIQDHKDILRCVKKYSEMEWLISELKTLIGKSDERPTD